MTGSGRRHYWERQARRDGALPPGEDLSAMRRGAGREAGSVPEMWRFYSVPSDGLWASPALVAEHHCLVMFGFHQQSQDRLVHQSGLTIGKALRRLRRSERFRDRTEALDARVAAAATATSVDEVASHLRGLIALLRDEGIPLDYTGLWRDLRSWGRPGEAERVRRSWGRDYFSWGDGPDVVGDEIAADNSDVWQGGTEA